ncbi:GntR family transcriptional regulator [Streptomyces sp. NPDC056525]|uniref:GntR family transcriptional regulator n=1 Tax=unclassified Streptomyces TaxID=2593676 RepID=UPI0036A4096E
MTLPLEDDNRPPYVQVAEYLRRQIQSGELGPGDKVPSSRELQEKFGLASATIQNAFRLLKNEGLIYSVQGRGSFIRRPATEPETPEAEHQPGGMPSVDTPPGPNNDARVNELAQQVASLRRDVSTMQDTLLEFLKMFQELKNQTLGEDA